MNRYVLKINDSTYITDIRWIMFEIPHQIYTGKLEDAMIVRDEYLNEPVTKTGFGIGVSRIDVLLRKYPHVKVVKIKLVEDE